MQIFYKKNGYGGKGLQKFFAAKQTRRVQSFDKELVNFLRE